MLTCRGQIKVSKDLTLQYDKKLYLFEDNEEDLRSLRNNWIRIPLWQQATGTHPADDEVLVQYEAIPTRRLRNYRKIWRT